jgi:hypothetical protein
MMDSELDEAVVSDGVVEGGSLSMTIPFRESRRFTERDRQLLHHSPAVKRGPTCLDNCQREGTPARSWNRW